jgi:hypothetical protein
MYVEFTPAQALQMARDLDECARIAIARDAPGADQTAGPNVLTTGLAAAIRQP